MMIIMTILTDVYRCFFVGNESLNISDNTKTVLPGHTFIFTLKIQVNRTNQIVQTVVVVLPTCKQICF